MPLLDEFEERIKAIVDRVNSVGVARTQSDCLLPTGVYRVI